MIQHLNHLELLSGNSKVKKFNLKKKVVCLTSYNKFSAQIADKYCDLILVGDSVGMAYYGDKSTRFVSMQEIIRHGKSVRQGVKNAILVVDMPYGTYKNSPEAVKNAKKIVKETKCDAVKIEGGYEVSLIAKNIIKNKINVMGHIGLQPQKIKKNDHYRVIGHTFSEQEKLFKDIDCLQKAGVFSIVVEAVKNKVSNQLVKKSKVPIIGIGASKNCHGQVLVLEDMLGMFEKVPKFVKRYSNLNRYIEKAIQKYSKDVRNEKFPSTQNIYK